MFDLVELQEDLQELLGVKVDVVSEAGLRPGAEIVVDEARAL